MQKGISRLYSFLFLLIASYNSQAVTVVTDGYADAVNGSRYDYLGQFFYPDSSQVHISISFDIERGYNINSYYDIEAPRPVFNNFTGIMSWTNYMDDGSTVDMEVTLSPDTLSLGFAGYKYNFFTWNFRYQSGPTVNGWELGGGVMFQVEDYIFSEEGRNIDFVDLLQGANFGGISLMAQNGGFTSVTNRYQNAHGVVNVTPVPLPAAIWFFGIGLLGLTGLARSNHISN